MPYFRSFTNATTVNLMVTAAFLGLGCTLVNLVITATLLATGCSHDPEMIYPPEAIVSKHAAGGPHRPSGVDRSLLDHAVSPGDDFYGFANGEDHCPGTAALCLVMLNPSTEPSCGLTQAG